MKENLNIVNLYGREYDYIIKIYYYLNKIKKKRNKTKI